MARFLPAQIVSWTKGELVQPPQRNGSDHFYRGITTDTRRLRPGEIFLALRGDRFDGHDFVPEALRQSAGLLVLDAASAQAAELLEKVRGGEYDADLLLVQDTLTAYQRIAAGYRQTLLASLIAITGSVGKTTTRRMVSTVISDQLTTHETKDNQNNLIGVPLTILKADDDDDAVIAELGMDRRGEIAVLSEISRPDVSIITGIGYSHAAYLGSRENILKEKMDIIRGMKPNGLLLLNGQDEYLNNWLRENKGRISAWRICNERCDKPDGLEDVPAFWAEDITVTPAETTFIVKSALDPAIDYPVHIPFPGKHLVRAAVFAIAAAYALGLDVKRAASACSAFRNTGGRLSLSRIGSWMVLDDSYNASPESVMSAMDTLQLLAGSNRAVACLGGLRELGQYEEELHRAIGTKLCDCHLNEIFLVGEETRFIEKALQDRNCDIPVVRAATCEDIAEVFWSHLREGDYILLKGSRFYEMEKLLKMMEARTGKEGTNA